MAVGMECHDGGVGGMGIKNTMVDVVVSQDYEDRPGGHVEFVLECTQQLVKGARFVEGVQQSASGKLIEMNPPSTEFLIYRDSTSSEQTGTISYCNNTKFQFRGSTLP